MPETVGRYEILDKIGQGGMGAVYKAFDPLLHRTVAVKLISAVLDDKPEIRERFFREARSAGQLSHKNIIVIYDLGEERGQPFLAMEYLTGRSLAAWISRGARVPVGRAVDVMMQVCEGLEYAHARGVVHRDITPGNVFVTDSDEVKILDFGLAHLVSSELTRSETIMGTANYMSPEQVRGERVDRRADIFATGVVLYELLAGRRAFEGDSFANTLFKVLESVPQSLHALDPLLPVPVIAVVERALAKRREDRYQTAGEMLRDLIACRDWLHKSPRSVPAITMAPTVAVEAPAAGVRSVMWSPRRVRTTAIVGSLLAATAALLLFTPRDRTAEPVSAPVNMTPEKAQATSGPSQAAPAPVPAPAPAPAPPPTTTTAASKEPVKPAEKVVERTADPAAMSRADRARADAAIARARQARSLADQAGADALAAYRKAISTEGEATGLYAAGQFGRAVSRALDAAAMYRGAEIEARAERAARERIRPEPAQPALTPAVVAEPPAPEPTKPTPAEPSPAPPPDPRPAIRGVLNQYVAALEARNLAALKALWPSLSGAQERALKAEFSNARTLQVRLSDPRIDVDDQTATVSASREYQLITADGHRLSSTARMTMKLRRAGEGWVIEGVAYQ